MGVAASDLERTAEALAKELVRSGTLEPAVPAARIRERLRKVLADNFAEEAEIERTARQEAERIASEHRGEMAGIDRHRLLELIKQRIARQRGFVL